MKLDMIKTSVLVNELVNRIGIQLNETDTDVDDVLSFLSENELDWLRGELMETTIKVRDRIDDVFMDTNL